jgi:hypothetical protein
MTKPAPFARRILRDTGGARSAKVGTCFACDRAPAIKGCIIFSANRNPLRRIMHRRAMRGVWLMSRISPVVLLAFLGAALTAAPALAQFGPIFGPLFGEPPPRPPQSVPGSRQQQQQQQQQQPRSDQPPQTLQQPGPPSRSMPQGNIQSQPLPPPGGAQQPAQRQPQRGAPPPPAEAAVPPPPEEVATEPPGNKVVNPTSVFSGLDKITGRITSFDVAIGETVQFGALQVTPRACYTRPPTETPHTDAFIEVDEVTLQGEIKRIYTGWMFAASPGLHAVEHPIYDIWLTDCKGGQVAEAPAEEQPAPRARQQQQPRQQQQQQRRPPQQQF